MTARSSDHHASTADDAVDLEAVARWMDEHAIESGAISDVSSLGGGTQNIMLSFTRGERVFVLRRGPKHLRSTTNDSLRREMTILRALAGTAVPHPQLIAGCADAAVLGGSVFYLMEPVQGFNAAATLPALHAGDAETRHGMGLAMVDSLAELALVDYNAIGLADYGRPDGFLERQVPRWLAELESYAGQTGYPAGSLPGAATLAKWLTSEQPATSTPGIMHGDFHVANVMFSLDGPGVAAIVDWEMSTIGDPLLDLGWMLATWPGGDRPAGIGTSALGAAGGSATARELVARYALRAGRDVSEIHWYVVLACFKLGVILEGTYARACAGKARPEVGEQLHEIAIALFVRGRSLISGDEIM